MSGRFILVLVFFASPCVAGGLETFRVVVTDPPHASLNVSTRTTIAVTFDRPVDPGSFGKGVRAFNVFGRWSGPANGSIQFNNDDATLLFTPDEPFIAGENVFVTLSHDIAARDGTTLRSAGYGFSFWTHARRSPMQFEQVQSLTVRTTPGQPTQAYGGIASDLNNDGYSDVTIVNEITADLRVFMNTAGGKQPFAAFHQPTYGVGQRASPSEPADFNGDGNIDICVANIDVNSVSVLMGNGDGTFRDQIVIPVGLTPRGITVLDFDGDGDTDIANTNAAGNNVSLIENLGDGTFAPATFFEAGGNGEWSMMAADMNEDGITDLVVGARNSRTIVVQIGNGDGTFTFASSTFCGGRTWMLVVGDVNGDGHEDVVSANSQDNNAGVLFGDGKGGLSGLQTHATGAFCLATDLGDLDGDGDLDWTTSSFVGREWRVFTNDGLGGFTVYDTITAPQAGSCTLLHDVDNDGDNDLSLIDEIADVVLVHINSGEAFAGDFDGDGVVDLSDYGQFTDCAAAKTANVDCEVFDGDVDGDIDLVDFGRFQRIFSIP